MRKIDQNILSSIEMEKDSVLELAESPLTFTKSLQDSKTTEGEASTLECELSKPDVPVKWQKDGKEVKCDRTKGVSVKLDKRKHSLTISSIKPEDSGKYTVSAAEGLEGSCKLTVEGLLAQLNIFTVSCENVLIILST